MLGRLKTAARGVIGRHRRSGPVDWAHRIAAFVESAYANEGSDFASNGEAMVLERLAPADPRTAFDVGANEGDWLMGALRVWPRCHVHAFEVAPATGRRLAERVAGSGQADRVTVNALGLSDAAGVQPMYFFPGHPELTCDMPRHEDREAIRFDAALETGDAYVARHGVERIDFLKIDVEGAEHRVLEGLRDTLAAGRVACLQFEYGAFSIQTRVLLADYYARLGAGFWIGRIYPTYVDFRDYHWTLEDFRFANYCAVSRSWPDLKRLLEG
jgi:FkbM family methyltransferase